VGSASAKPRAYFNKEGERLRKRDIGGKGGAYTR
jgi:hypothetical protein